VSGFGPNTSWTTDGTERTGRSGFFPLSVSTILEPSVAHLRAERFRLLVYLLCLAWRRDDRYFGCVRRIGLGPYKQRDLGKLMGRSESFVSRGLSEFQEAGLIERVRIRGGEYICIANFRRWYECADYAPIREVVEERLSDEQPTLPVSKPPCPRAINAAPAKLSGSNSTTRTLPTGSPVTKPWTALAPRTWATRVAATLVAWPRGQRRSGDAKRDVKETPRRAAMTTTATAHGLPVARETRTVPTTKPARLVLS
jgi:hypothetical protein